SSVEEALMEMYFSGVSTRQVDAVGERLWGDRMPPQTLSDDLKRVYKDIDEWRNRPLERTFPYVFMDGIWLKRSWGGSIENVSVLVAIGVGDDGRREVIGVDEGMKEDTASWESFIRGLLERGLKGVRLAIGDRNPGLLHAVGELLPGARRQRCMVHFERNVLAKTPRRRRKPVAAKLKAVFAMEDRARTLEKAGSVAAELDSEKPKEAASCLREGIGEATAYQLPEFPMEHWRPVRTNNMVERLNREIRRRTRVVGQFPDGRSALMLVTRRIRHVTQNWP
ncbi:IS256 family transposase, partial [Bifidobacterium bohemicum]